MDNQDKIFDKFKDAAQNSESQDFPAMDKIWARVEDKLDKKEDKRAISLWKKIAIAASFLLLLSLGAQFLKTDKTTTTPNSKVVINEKETIPNPVLEKDHGVLSEDSNLVSKTVATKVLDKQIKQQQQVALQEDQIATSDASIAINSALNSDEVAAPVPAQIDLSRIEEENTLSKAKEIQRFDYAKKTERASFKAAQAEHQSELVQKSSPLIVLNGKPLAHSNDEKRDKMMQAELSNLQPQNVDSLIVLDAPLYIIDGIYYSENDLFGANPTSPYAPLNQQEIKTITILQDLEATSKYGDRGKKGVVIITTKTGKPAPKK